MTTRMRRLFDANLFLWLMALGAAIGDHSKVEFVIWPCFLLAAIAQHWAYYRWKDGRTGAAEAARASAAG